MMITGNDGISYYKKNGHYFSNSGWLERQISKEQYDKGIQKALSELNN